MYKKDCGVIANAMNTNVRIFERGVMFALLSARTQFTRVPDQMKELKAKGADANCLWGWKFGAYQFMQENAATVYGNVVYPKGLPLRDRLARVCAIPGMGIVKGAFVLQLLGYDVACLDARNIIRDGRETREFRTDGIKSGKAFMRKIDRYLAEVEGKAEHYWNAWCEDVGKVYGETADNISWLHVRAIVPLPMRRFTMEVPCHTNMEEIPF